MTPLGAQLIRELRLLRLADPTQVSSLRPGQFSLAVSSQGLPPLR